MITNMYLLSICVTRLSGESGLPSTHIWKQRPSAVVLGGFRVTDNSTGVFAPRSRLR